MPNQSLESIIKESLEGFPQNSKYIMEIPVFNPENGFPFLEGNLKEQQGACAEYFAQIFTPQNSAGALNSLNCTQKLLYSSIRSNDLHEYLFLLYHSNNQKL